MILNLRGELIPTEWAEIYRYWGYETGFYCPADVEAAIQSLEDTEELELHINSVGGNVDAAAEIYSMLEDCQNDTYVLIQSLAASAASYFILAADRVEMSLPAQMMIHCASCGLSGNAQDHSWVSGMLAVTDNSILDVYCRKCGSKADREQLHKMMEEETYLSARQCLELGLVDAVVGDESEEPPANLAASVSNNIVRCMRTLPDIQELMAKSEQETEWQEKARLELERVRFAV